MNELSIAEAKVFACPPFSIGVYSSSTHARNCGWKHHEITDGLVIKAPERET